MMGDDEISKLLVKSIVRGYTPQQRIFPISVIGLEIYCENELDENLDEISDRIKSELLSKRNIYRVKATEPKNYGNMLVISLLKEGTKKENLLETVADDFFVRIRRVPIKVAPTESTTTFCVFLDKNDKNKVKVYALGGKEDFQRMTIDYFKSIVIRSISCKNHEIKMYDFRGRGMYIILDKIVENIAYLVIDPKYNEKFAKILAKKGGKPNLEDVEYLVDFIKIRGFKITKSPGIASLLEEENILIDEIIGQWKYDSRNNITVWVRRDGRVTFYLSGRIVFDEDSAKDKGIELYTELLRTIEQENLKPKPIVSLEPFIE